DDAPSVIEVIRSALGGLGYDVECALTAAAAREKISGGGFAVAIIDCVIPGGPGASLAALAKKPGIGVLLMSGHPEVIAAPEAGFRFLAKPFRLVALKMAIDALAMDAQFIAR